MAGINMHMSAAARSLLNTRFLQGAVSAWQGYVNLSYPSRLTAKIKP